MKTTKEELIRFLTPFDDNIEIDIDPHYVCPKGEGKIINRNSLPMQLPVKPANGKHSGECRMCFTQQEELYHFDFYVTGSEGIWICSDCRLQITKKIRIIKANNLNAKLQREKASRLSV